MDMFYGKKIDGALHLSDAEQKHLRVMRKSVGERIAVADGEGHVFTALIIAQSKRSIELQIVEQTSHLAPSDELCLAVAPTKNASRYEWMIEKLTEVGVTSIQPIYCEHSERKHLRMDRLQAHAVAAMKQSQRHWLPAVLAPMSFSDFIQADRSDHRLIASCDWEHTHDWPTEMHASATILIGPEGGFSPVELSIAIKHGYLSTRLSSHRLRTETAALYAAVRAEASGLRLG